MIQHLTRNLFFLILISCLLYPEIIYLLLHGIHCLIQITEGFIPCERFFCTSWGFWRIILGRFCLSFIHFHAFRNSRIICYFIHACQVILASSLQHIIVKIRDFWCPVSITIHFGRVSCSARKLSHPLSFFHITDSSLV